MSVKTGEQNLLLPLFSVRLGEEESLQCRLKRHRFRLLSFFWVNSNEMASFFPKRAVLFKWELVPKTRQIQNQAFNLRAFCILVLDFGFLQLSP